jgi:hypothetical protein
MRWQTQSLTSTDIDALPGMARLSGLVRSAQTPEFAGVTFHEVRLMDASSQVSGCPDSRRRPRPLGRSHDELISREEMSIWRN